MTIATQVKEKTVELKICERCGGLWLRPANSGWIYCALCKREVNALPVQRPRPETGTASAPKAKAAARRTQ